MKPTDLSLQPSKSKDWGHPAQFQYPMFCHKLDNSSSKSYQKGEKLKDDCPIRTALKTRKKVNQHFIKTSVVAVTGNLTNTTHVCTVSCFVSEMKIRNIDYVCTWGWKWLEIPGKCYCKWGRRLASSPHDRRTTTVVCNTLFATLIKHLVAEILLFSVINWTRIGWMNQWVN